jgi:hypothetical protein
MSNVRMQLRGFHGTDVPGDLYAKVSRSEPGRGFVVRFTAVPPEVLKFLEAVRATPEGGA